MNAWSQRLLAVLLALASLGVGTKVAFSLAVPAAPKKDITEVVVFGYNDLGMHCMNEDFSEMCILPPFNTLHAQIIDRSEENPRIVTSDVQVHYSVPGNTHSADKTNFWKYAGDLFGMDLPPEVGLTGNGLAGQMSPTGNRDWNVTGIPITPLDDAQNLNPYQLALITATVNGVEVGRTQAVVPVSQELTCSLCHSGNGVSVEQNILRSHDRLHGTSLVDQTPVLCASCHADPALGTEGTPGVSNLSAAMHSAHAPRMVQANLAVSCYACHPGVRTQCHRDVHLARGLTCVNCHGDENAVGNPERAPWVDEPRCADCHERPGFEFEEPGKLFRESRGHHGVMCMTCHSSPHAITPTVTDADNVQAERLQGNPGTITQCTVCHRKMPDEPFEHRFEADDD